MNCPILNREFQHPADNWYHIEPKGEFANAPARVVQVLDDAAMQSIANRFSADAAKPNFAGLLIDHEHFKHQADQETRAYGWLMKVENRADGLYGQIRWTATGKAAVDGGDYRFFSTEYSPADLQVLNRDGAAAGEPRRVRPMRLSGLTLTNDPNNRGARPITNRADDDRRAQPQKQKDTMKSVAHALGLAPEASEEAILGAVQLLNRRATDAESARTTAQADVTRLQGEVTALQADRIAAVLAPLDSEPIKNRVNAEQREAWSNLLKGNFDAGRRAFTGFLATLQPQGGNSPAAPRQPITNRGSARTPQGAPNGGESAADPGVVFNRKVREYQNAHKCGYQEAHQAVSEAHPELIEQACAPAGA